MTIQSIIDRLRELHAASTQGEWQCNSVIERLHEELDWVQNHYVSGDRWICTLFGEEMKPTAELIASAHNHLPEVLAALETSLEYEKISDALAVKYCEQIAELKQRLEKQERALAVYSRGMKRLIGNVNHVSAYHRHGNDVPERSLTQLCNEQLDAEMAINEANQILEDGK